MSDTNPHWIIKNLRGLYMKFEKRSFVFTWMTNADDATRLDREDLLEVFRKLDVTIPDNDVLRLERTL